MTGFLGFLEKLMSGYFVFKNKRFLNLRSYMTFLRSYMTLLESREGVTGDRSQFKVFERVGYDFTGFDTGFSQKK